MPELWHGDANGGGLFGKTGRKYTGVPNYSTKSLRVTFFYGMATPINDAYEEAAVSGVKRVASDGESVDMHSLDELRRAAAEETKQANAGKKRLGIKMFRVRFGGAAPQ